MCFQGSLANLCPHILPRSRRGRAQAGGGAFDPSSIASLRLKATSLALSDTDPVSSWVDSISGNDASQATAGLKPLYRTSQIAGRPAVYFDGVDDVLFGGSASWCWVFAVCRPLNKGVSFMQLWGSSGVDKNFRIINFNPPANWYNDANDFGDSGSNWVDGVNTVSANLGAYQAVIATSATPQTFAYAVSNNFLGRVFYGYVAEIIAGGTPLTTGLRKSLEAYAGSEYGLTITP